MKKKLGRVGVLAGGPSSEREISLRSGKAVHDALVHEGIDAFFVDVRDNIYDIIKSVHMDVAFLALHGKFGEDGTVQKILDSAGIRYTGSSSEASGLALDKIASKEIFLKNGIPTPEYSVVERHCPAHGAAGGAGEEEFLASRQARSIKIPYHYSSSEAEGRIEKWQPIVVKPQFEGSSIGLSVVRERSKLGEAVDKAFKYGDKVLIEEYIEGRELTVGILNDRPLPVIEIVPKEKVYDYNAKYNDSGTQYLVPAPIGERETRRAQSLGERAHAALGCRSFSRVDMMMDGAGNIFVLEVNTIPGMTGRSLLPKAAVAAGLSFNKLCVKLIEDALRGC